MTGFARRHALFGAVLLAAVAVRVIVMLGFPGAMLIPDSADYVAVALRPVPFVIRPDGYSVMLRLLRPLHSLTAPIAVQHAMGVGIGVAGYALLRRKGLPGWAATLAMVPVLLSGYALQLEHFLLSDTLFAFLVMIAIVAVMWWPDPPLWIYALTGLLLAAATLVRSQGLPLVAVFLVCLIIRFARWRTIVGVLVLCAAFAIPVAGYAKWFESVNGTFQITNSNGAFLYATAITFADCAKIKPPPDERRLCLNVPVSKRNYSQLYIWSEGPLRTLPGGVFGNLADKLGTNFALRAIRAQPADYLRLVWSCFWENFRLDKDTNATVMLQRESAAFQRDEMFPAVLAPPPAYADHYYDAYDPAGPDLRVVQPYAGWIREYQRVIVVSGPLLGVILLTGLAGIVVAWRRIGGPALLPWLTGVVLIVAPAASAGVGGRYLVCAVAPLCVAAAIGVRDIAGLAARHSAGRRQPHYDAAGGDAAGGVGRFPAKSSGTSMMPIKIGAAI